MIRDLKRERIVARAEQEMDGGLKPWKSSRSKPLAKRPSLRDTDRWLKEAQEWAEFEKGVAVSPCIGDEFSS